MRGRFLDVGAEDWLRGYVTMSEGAHGEFTGPIGSIAGWLYPWIEFGQFETGTADGPAGANPADYWH